MSAATQKEVLPTVFQLNVTITLWTRDVDTFLQHFRPIYHVVAAEPECSYFVVRSTHPPVAQDFSSVSPDKDKDTTVLRWIEGWTKDFQWFLDVQLKKPYYRPYFEATERLFVAPRVVEVFEPVAGLNEFKA